MRTITDKIQAALTEFNQGNAEEALCLLQTMPHDVLPALVAIFHEERKKDIRLFLVHAIWQHRQRSVIPFLAEILQHEPDPDIWKEALDGLVTLASDESLEALNAAKQRHFTKQKDTEIFLNWINEAIEQVQAEIKTAKDD